MTTQRAFPKSLSFNFTHRWSCCHAERCPPIERKLGVEFGLSCLTTQWWTAREHNWSVNLFNFWKKPALPIESHLQTTEKQKKIYFIIKPNNYHSSKPLGSKCFCSSVHESESNRVDCGCDGFRRYNVLSNNFLLKLSKSSLAFKWTTKPPTTFTTPGKGQPDCWSWKSRVSTRSFKKKQPLSTVCDGKTLSVCKPTEGNTSSACLTATLVNQDQNWCLESCRALACVCVFLINAWVKKKKMKKVSMIYWQKCSEGEKKYLTLNPETGKMHQWFLSAAAKPANVEGKERTVVKDNLRKDAFCTSTPYK